MSPSGTQQPPSGRPDGLTQKAASPQSAAKLSHAERFCDLPKDRKGGAPNLGPHTAMPGVVHSGCAFSLRLRGFGRGGTVIRGWNILFSLLMGDPEAGGPLVKCLFCVITVHGALSGRSLEDQPFLETGYVPDSVRDAAASERLPGGIDAVRAKAAQREQVVAAGKRIQIFSETKRSEHSHAVMFLRNSTQFHSSPYSSRDGE